MRFSSIMEGAAAALQPGPASVGPDFSAIFERALLKDESERRPSFRFNPSAVSRMCLYKRGRQIQDDQWVGVSAPNISLARLGLLGSGIHSEVQRRVYPHIGDRMFGEWMCPTCHASVIGMRPEAPCSGSIQTKDGRVILCDDHDRQDTGWRYREAYFQDRTLSNDDHHYWITTYLDGIYVDLDTWYVIELKTLAYTLYNEVYMRKSTNDDPRVVRDCVKNAKSRLPLPSHVAQAQICGSIVSRHIAAGDIPAPAAKYGGTAVLSMSRDSGDIKSSVSPPDDFPYLNLMSMMTSVKQAVENGRVDALKKKCKTRQAAKGCYLQDHCFPKKKRKKT